jgi:hypothetical protein
MRRSNPEATKKNWIASSQGLLAMTLVHTALSVTRKPSLGFGIGHICHCGV